MVLYLLSLLHAEVVELADALDSKSSDGNIMRVQVPPSAPKTFRITSESLFVCAPDMELTWW